MECLATSGANTSRTSNNFQQENRSAIRKSNGSNYRDSEQYEHEGDEQIILDIFGKLIQPFEDLEKPLSDVQEIDRTTYLSNVIVGALSIFDPIKSIQNTLNFCHSIKGKVKIVSYVSRRMKIPHHQAEVCLAELIRSSRYYDNILNILKSKKFFKQIMRY
ncbi:MAG: hypothetical protein L0H53_05215 [Candidatus Nitrosocosmicus sp.]|nr:hypothetical protein [Candidatus Nitrosocosmicus sp.]MDN5868796.1 hypothetical protein [Candidatus Nitrosocosmicus sp.]